ncbi:RNA recognition domain-containing protein [Drepanopeziza brunnea f. sp. 'multigermtubi' MB_m1]|uniref:RNA recognition domain-containing protein n=1 Tax=Marssonina brunnea f. sp. multigermtubi (strain MB_m1) TaxID=1072389 RepID=K1Y7H3_MARBU|nr:RNA recognition domain-containing protein [Drepanopeziza brunnea f. sp. 'multigermtubi' MB_m1]EKD21069.1 RNA recognition domain-containing protein [Drepanopeziza brunnea f. sp. 'multigermtubi' MB_m1]
MASMDYENENGSARYEDEAPRYERDRSASPRPNRRESPRGGPRRSASPNGNGHADSRGPPKNDRGAPQDDGAINPGSNLFVTGIHPRLSEQEVTRLFEKYGDVEKCQIMLDPHTKESRGFGFVKMVTADQADAAKEGLQGEVIEGRTLSIEKARRSRPRTPTPGKYFGPPKRGKMGVDPHQDATVSAMMIVAAVAEDMEDVITTADTAEEDAVMTVTVAMVEIAMIMALVEDSTATLAMIDTAVEEMIDVEVAEVVTGEDVITTEVVIVALPVKHLHQPLPMVIQHLVGRLGNHTEVVSALLVKFARSRRARQELWICGFH